MFRKLLPGFILLFCSYRLLAINATVSHIVFYGDGKTPYAEINWDINPQTLHFKTVSDKSIVAAIKIDIAFINADGSRKEDPLVQRTTPCKDASELSSLLVRNQKRYELSGLKTTVSVVMTDLADSNNKYTFTDSIIAPTAPDKPFYSGLQLLDTAYASAEGSPFYRNGYTQYPSTSNFMDEGHTNLHYYYELYNLSKLDKKDFPLVQQFCIARREFESQILRLSHKDTINSPTELMAMYGSLPIVSLGSGNYYLCATLDNSRGQRIASKSLFFQRFNKHPVVDQAVKEYKENDTAMEHITVLDLDKTFLKKYSLAQIRAILKMLIPVSDPMGVATINGFLKKPDEMYMRYYIYNFFAAINKKEPGKAWKEYSERVMEVNKKFTARAIPGYETERGLIYLKYGPPTDIITVSSESGCLPYEVWQYNVLTQSNKKDIPDAVFLFYKVNDINADYTLLHSNVQGEPINKSWRSFLYVNVNGVNNVNSRAEQYIGDR